MSFEPLSSVFVTAIVAVSLISSGLYGAWLTRAPPSALRTLVKTAGLALLALAAALAQLPWLLVLALAASAAGDGMLAGPGQGRFLAGVAAFAVAHGAYVPLFVSLGAWEGPLALWQLAAMAGLVLAAGMLLVRVLWAHLGALRWPLAGYFAIILAMGLTALAQPPGPGTTAIQIGAALFLASDMILGVELFRLQTGSRWMRLTGPAIWTLYFGGQALIAWGVLAATLAG